MSKYGFIFLMIFMVNPLYAEIFKWVDSNGVVHFSDKPQPGAKKITLPPMQTFTPPETTAPVESKTPVADEEKATRGYTSIAIIQPASEATIRNNQGYVPVIAQLQPELKSGDMLQILFDGNPLGKPQATLIFALNDVKRGTHTIAVQVLDSEGEVLNTSEEVTFYMQRPRVGMVPNTRPARAP